MHITKNYTTCQVLFDFLVKVCYNTQKRGCASVQYNELHETTVKSIRFDKELTDKINELAAEAERDFSQQVRFMLKKYIQLKEGS